MVHEQVRRLADLLGTPGTSASGVRIHGRCIRAGAPGRMVRLAASSAPVTDKDERGEVPASANPASGGDGGLKRCKSSGGLSHTSDVSLEGGLGILDTGGTADLLDSNCTLLSTNLLESNATSLDSHSLTATERWRRSYRLIQAALAFSKSFRTLRDMSKENTIDPRRLTKIKDLGKGAFADVELCMLENETPGVPPTPVAVKRLRFETVKRRSDLKRFFKEANMMRKLRHRYIASYIGVGNFSYHKFQKTWSSAQPEDAKSVLKSTFIVQEYIPGGSLRDLVLHQMLSSDELLYSDLEACTWMQQVSEGLLYLHTASPKVMHRDLKLENILLRDLGKGVREACLVDFGISVFLPRPSRLLSSFAASERRSPERSEVSTAHTAPEPRAERKERMSSSVGACIGTSPTAERHGHVVAIGEDSTWHHRAPAPTPPPSEAFDLTGRAGSYMYMAPEVFCHRGYNEKADVFSLACLLYEVFGRVILSTQVTGPGHKQAARRYAEEVAAGYRRPFPKGMPVPLQRLIADCWAGDPDQRPSMDVVLARLRGLAASDVFRNAKARQGQEACLCCCTLM